MSFLQEKTACRGEKRGISTPIDGVMAHRLTMKFSFDNGKELRKNDAHDGFLRNFRIRAFTMHPSNDGIG